jgi:hypothetical protein
MLTTPTLFLITNCSATKRVASGDAVQIRNWQGSVRQRFRWWQHAIAGQFDGTPARDCYAGDAWSQVVAAEKSSRGPSELWVVSAGLGIISADFRIPNYSATFISNSIDSVGTSHEARSQWWELVCDWRRKVCGVGSITDLAEKNPKSIFLIALSSAYLAVVKNDLLLARSVLESPDNLVIISAGTRSMPEMGYSLLPIDARFENLVGGARATLNSRMLRYIVENFDIRKCNARKITKSLNITATELEKPKLFDRERLDDVEIAEFIHKQSKLVNSTSASALLRILRDSGAACEQKRFHRIYRSIHLKQI